MKPPDFNTDSAAAISSNEQSSSGTPVTDYIGPATSAPVGVKTAAPPFTLPETKAEPPSVYGSGQLIQLPPGSARSTSADLPFEPFFAIGGSFSVFALFMSVFILWNAATSSPISSRRGETWFTLALAAIGLVICSLSFLTAEAGDGAVRSAPVRRLRSIAVIADTIIIILSVLQIIFSWLP